MTATVLAADIGRTTCRLARYAAGARVGSTEVPCGVSLSDAGGVGALRRVVGAALARLPAGPPWAAAAFGVTGASQCPAQAGELRAALATDLSAPVTVVGDVVTAHAGAFAGGPGVLTIAGTGAVALGVTATGTATVVDGWGPLLGDAGSAVDVGRAGLSAALRAHDGRGGGSPALAAAAAARFGDLDDLPGRVGLDAQPFRVVGTFARDVAAAARVGDRVAAAILADAVAALAETTTAACRRTADPAGGAVGVVLAGGLFDVDDLVTSPLRAALVTGGRPRVEVRAAVGDALDGAHALATGAAGLHRSLRWARAGPDPRDTARDAGAAGAGPPT